MTASLGDAYVRIRPYTKGFSRELSQDIEAETKQASFSLFDAVSIGATVAGAKKLVDSASGLQQAVGGTAAVFADASGAIDEFAKTAATSAGLSERAAREATSAIGAMLQGAGFAADEAAKTSVQLTKLAADLSATFGGTPEEAVQALGAALRGETDPLERFGVALNQTAVNAKAVELGLAETTSSVDQNAKAQATLALITERSASAQGQFAREADTAAGQAAIAAAKTENAAADLGESLLPIYTKLAEAAGVLGSAFAALPDPAQTAIIAIAGLALVAGPVTRGFGQARDSARQLTSSLRTNAGAVQHLTGGLVTLGGTIAVVEALTFAADQLGKSLTDGKFGQAGNDVAILADSLRKAGQTGDFGAITDDISGLANAVKTLADKETTDGLAEFGNFVTTALTDEVQNVDGAAEAIRQVDQALADLIAEDPAAGAAAFAELRDALIANGAPADTLARSFALTGEALNDFARTTAVDGIRVLLGLQEATEEAGDEAVTTSFKFEQLATKIGDAVGAAKRLDDAIFGRQDADIALQDAQLGLQDAQFGLRDAQQDVNDAVREYGPNSMEAAEAVNNRAQAELALQRAQLDLISAQRDLNQANRDLTTTVDSATIPAIERQIEAIERLKAEAPLAAGGIALLNDELDRLAQQAGKIGTSTVSNEVFALGRNAVIAINAGRGNYPPLRPGG